MTEEISKAIEWARRFLEKHTEASLAHHFSKEQQVAITAAAIVAAEHSGNDDDIPVAAFAASIALALGRTENATRGIH